MIYIILLINYETQFQISTLINMQKQKKNQIFSLSLSQHIDAILFLSLILEHGDYVRWAKFYQVTWYWSSG